MCACQVRIENVLAADFVKCIALRPVQSRCLVSVQKVAERCIVYGSFLYVCELQRLFVCLLAGRCVVRHKYVSFQVCSARSLKPPNDIRLFQSTHDCFYFHGCLDRFLFSSQPNHRVRLDLCPLWELSLIAAPWQRHTLCDTSSPARRIG